MSQISKYQISKRTVKKKVAPMCWLSKQAAVERWSVLDGQQKKKKRKKKNKDPHIYINL